MVKSFELKKDLTEPTLLEISGARTHRDLAAAASKFMCCIELRAAMTL
jgi:hypothetical protein